MITTKPNELIIELRTSIPGNQLKKFEPSMVIKNLSRNDKSVLFNPLKKLNQKTIDKVPGSLRIKQFFNTGGQCSKTTIKEIYNNNNVNNSTDISSVETNEDKLVDRYSYIDNIRS